MPQFEWHEVICNSNAQVKPDVGGPVQHRLQCNCFGRIGLKPALPIHDSNIDWNILRIQGIHSSLSSPFISPALPLWSTQCRIWHNHKRYISWTSRATYKLTFKKFEAWRRYAWASLEKLDLFLRIRTKPTDESCHGMLSWVFEVWFSSSFWPFTVCYQNWSSWRLPAEFSAVREYWIFESSLASAWTSHKR